MKDKTGWITRLILVTLLAMTCAFTGCAGFTQKQKIATACESAATALDTLTLAKQSGKISAADLSKGIAVYKRTVPVCQPVAENLDAVKYAALAAAAAELTALAGEAK